MVELSQGKRLNTLFSGLVREQLQDLLKEQGISVIFNLEGIHFIDTAGFEVLQEMTRWALLHDSQFKLCNVNDDVRELILLLELEGNLTFCRCENASERVLMVLD